jgi:hypothetical protein
VGKWDEIAPSLQIFKKLDIEDAIIIKHKIGRPSGNFSKEP